MRFRVQIVGIIVLLLTLCSRQAFCYDVNPEKGREKRIGKIVKLLNKENVYQYYITSNAASEEKTAYAIIIERYEFLSFKLIVYKVNHKTGKTKEIYRDDTFPFLVLRVIPISKGFITITRAGAGRRFKYFAYIENKGKMKSYFIANCDILEMAYYRGYNGMPHLFASELYCRPLSDEEKVEFYITDIFEWNEKSQAYKKVKTLKYDKKLKPKDRFKFKKGKTPFFSPLALFLR